MRRINLLALCCWSLYVKTHALLYTCIHLQSVCQNCNFYGTAPLCCFCNGWGSNHKRRTGGGAGRPTHPPFPFWPDGVWPNVYNLTVSTCWNQPCLSSTLSSQGLEVLLNCWMATFLFDCLLRGQAERRSSGSQFKCCDCVVKNKHHCSRTAPTCAL